MPHRFHGFEYSLAFLVEGLALASIALWQTIAGIIPDAEWQILRGQDGYTYALILAIVVLWGSNVASGRREEKNRERRHLELLEANAVAAEENKSLMADLKALTAESIKANLMGTQSIVILTNELKERPCQKCK